MAAPDQHSTHPATIRLSQLKERRLELTMLLRSVDVQAANLERERVNILAELAPLEAAMEGAAMAQEAGAEAERARAAQPDHTADPV